MVHMLCILVPEVDGNSLSSAPSLTVFVFKKKKEIQCKFSMSYLKLYILIPFWSLMVTEVQTHQEGSNFYIGWC